MSANFEADRLGPYTFSSRKMPDGMHYSMAICGTCHLLYATEIPSANWIAQEYREAAYASASEARFAADTYIKALTRLQPPPPDRDGILDIGAGDGAFLERLDALGFTGLVGIEPSRAPVSQARPSLQSRIRNEFFGDSDYGDGRFSLITCFQTLEHIDQPKSVYKRIYRLLKPGGVFMSVVHNYRSWTARLLGTKSPIFDIEHLQLFDSYSLEFAYRKTGFVSISVSPLGNTYPLSYWLRLAPLSPDIKQRLLSAMDRLGVGSLSLSLRVGNLVGTGVKPH
jgi:SAM-dependent methyltransferase